MRGSAGKRRAGVWRLWAVALLLAGGAVGARADDAAPATDAKPAVEETWQVAYIGKVRVGFGRSTVERQQREGREIIVSETEMSMAISRFGQSVKIRTVAKTEETVEGQLLNFSFLMLNPPAAATQSAGSVKGEQLTLTTEVGGKSSQSQVPWDESIKSPNYQDRMLRETPLKPGEKRTLKSFDPQFGKTVTITLQAGQEQLVEVFGGQKQTLLKVTISTSIAPLIKQDMYLNGKGEALVTQMNLLGMASYKVSKEEALKSISGEEADLAVATLVKTQPIERAQQTDRVVYRITTPGDDPETILSVGSTQRVERIGPDVVDLVVSAILPPAQQPERDAEPGNEFLEPNKYIQSDDARVRQHADQAAGALQDHWEIAQAMERWVQKNLKQKNFSTLLASAAEVAKDLSGDCTEHAVLLAAMARSRGIPSRVAVGLVYVHSASAFGGHMWTEVFVRGTWVPLDATLGQGGIAAEHIKFADSSFSDDGEASPLASFLPLVTVLGKMRIDVKDIHHAPNP
ncbi:MAG: transglutaminase-like domain-containing protein [Planctomycetales bacterium]